MRPICIIRTPFLEKFGVPRQSPLIPEAKGTMHFPKDDFFSEAFRGLEESSHLWLIFEFHQISEEKLKGLIRPPRFENKKKMGVFATRSPHRPNRLGLSVVKFESLHFTDKEIILTVSGVDLVDGTPIFDIKPYVPYADALPQAKTPFQNKPPFIPVEWTCEKPVCWELIEKTVALDPRPSYEKESEKEYGVSVAGYNVRFHFAGAQFHITNCRKLP